MDLSSWKRFLLYLYLGLGTTPLFFPEKGIVIWRKKINKVVLLSKRTRAISKNHENLIRKENGQSEPVDQQKRCALAETLKVVEKEQFSPAHNERFKVEKINDLNIKLQTMFGEKEAQIRSVKSKEDKLIRGDRLNKTYF